MEIKEEIKVLKFKVIFSFQLNSFLISLKITFNLYADFETTVIYLFSQPTRFYTITNHKTLNKLKVAIKIELKLIFSVSLCLFVSWWFNHEILKLALDYCVGVERFIS